MNICAQWFWTRQFKDGMAGESERVVVDSVVSWSIDHVVDLEDFHKQSQSTSMVSFGNVDEFLTQTTTKTTTVICNKSHHSQMVEVFEGDSSSSNTTPKNTEVPISQQLRTPISIANPTSTNDGMKLYSIKYVESLERTVTQYKQFKVHFMKSYNDMLKRMNVIPVNENDEIEHWIMFNNIQLYTEEQRYQLSLSGLCMSRYSGERWWRYRGLVYAIQPDQPGICLVYVPTISQGRKNFTAQKCFLFLFAFSLPKGTPKPKSGMKFEKGVVKKRCCFWKLILTIFYSGPCPEMWKENLKAYITEGSRVVSYLNTNSARWCLTSLFEMGRGGSTVVWT